MRFLFFFITFSFLQSFVFAEGDQPDSGLNNCLDLQIEVLQEPFCQGSFNGGQLKVNVSSGSGSYSYEWLSDNGGYIPGGPQTNASTFSFLTINEAYWVYVTDNITNCYDSISYTFTDYSCQEDTASLQVQNSFDLNPVGYSEYTVCDIGLTNLGCQLNFKPEFIISHQTEDIEQGDFIIEFYNAQSNWESISYSIDSNGDAIGYWGSQIGETANCDYTQVRPVRVKFNQFNPTAPTGDYTVTLRLWSVDANGDLLSIVSDEVYVSLTLLDTICEDISLISQLTDASCSEINDGQIILSGSGGQAPYLFSLSNSPYANDSIFEDLSYGIYFASLKDANGCQNSDTIHIGPQPILPDSLWFAEIYSSNANIYWHTDSLVDGYKFRYREVGQFWQGPVVSGFYSNSIAEMFTFKTLYNLNAATTYEVQVKANSLIGCEEGWSTEIYTFTTPLVEYVYNVNNTCVGVNSGQIEFGVISDNGYTFNWQGQDGFSSTENSIYNLAAGEYNLQISNGQDIIFDSTFVVSVSDSNIGVSLNGDTSLVFYSEQEGVYFAQACDLGSYIIADDGYSNYSWRYNGIINYIQDQQILMDTSNVFVQVEALDTNNCLLTSDSVHISVVSDFVDFINANTNEDYLDDIYEFCSADSSISIDLSSFLNDNYTVEWREVVGATSIILSQNPSIDILPVQNTAYSLNVSSCSSEFYVNFYQSPTLEVEHEDLLCFGESNAIIFIATDASGLVDYSLTDSLGDMVYFNSTISLFDTIGDLSAGEYTIELIDNNLCDIREEVHILQADSLFFDDLQVQHIECYGQNLGSVAYKLLGGTSPYYFLLNGDTIAPLQDMQGYYNIDNLIPSDYTIKVFDANGCHRSLDFEILEAAEMVFSINSFSDTINCFGDSTAYINLNASGGTPDYTFYLYSADSLFIQQSSSIFFDLPANDYEIIMTDNFGCTDSLYLTINQNAPLSVTEDVSLHQDIFCNGDSTGFITFIVEGGNFNSDNDFFTVSLDSLSAGYYFYEVTDSSSCYSRSDSVQITEPFAVEISLISLQNINCSNPLGTVEFQAQGGALPYFYTVNNIDTFEVVLSNQTITLSNLAEGGHTLKLFDVNSCVDSMSFSIEDHTTFNLTIFDISDTLSCYGDTTGYVQIDAGLVGTYNYSLIQATDIITPQQQLSYFGGLTAGDYIVVAIDEQACQDSIYFTIVENSELVIYEDLALHQDVLCDGSSLGSMTPVVDGGVAPYSIELIGDSVYTYPHQFNNLSIGNYVVLLQDSEECSQELSFSIVVDEVVVSDSLDLHEDVSCYGATDGAFMLNIESDFPSHFIRLTDTSSTIFPWYSHPHLFDGLAGGVYQIEVATSEDDECTFIYEVQVFEPQPFLLDSILVSDVICKGDSTGALEIFLDDDTSEFTYLLNNDSSIISNKLYATNYSLEIFDTNGCTIDTNFTVNEPNELILSVIDSLTIDVSCFGFNDGQIGLAASGGIPPYKFSILGEEPQDTNVIDELVADTFKVSVTDHMGCVDSIIVVVSQPESVNIDNYELSDSLGYCTLCYGDSTGSIDITVSGGTPEYFYYLKKLSDALYSPLFEHLVGGEQYEFFVLDIQGCSSDTLTVACTSPEELLLDVESDTLPSCCYTCDSEVLLYADGGIAPYSYAFEDSIFQSSGFFDHLCGDSTYFFKVKDSHGCIKQQIDLDIANKPCLTVDTLNFVNSELPALIHSDICQEDGTAKIYTSALEGFGNYSFKINDGTFIQQDEIIFDSLYQGNHYIIVKDELNCLDTLSFVVNDPNPIIISDLTIDTIFCGAPTINSSSGQSDIGAINAVAAGASSGVYFYSIDQIDSLLYQPNGLFESLDSGYYSMNIMDLNDCVQEFDIFIPFYSANVDYSISDVSCPSFSDGIVEIDSIIGGFDPWITLDDDTANNSIFSSLSEGQYNLEVNYLVPSSSELCTFSQTVEIVDKEPLEFSYDLAVPSCNAICDGSIAIGQIVGGTSPYTLICVNTSDTSLIFDDLCAGDYAIKIIDSNGCFKIHNIVMSEPNAIYPIIDFEDGQLMVLEPTIGNPFSGIPPFSYQWYNSNGPIVGANDSLFIPDINGNYFVEVSDSSDCMGYSSFYNIEVLSMSTWTNNVVDVYPNPFEDILNVSLSISDGIHWTLIDIRGSTIQAGYDALYWNISTLELVNGIYFLKLKKDNNELIYKIIKQ